MDENSTMSEQEECVEQPTEVSLKPFVQEDEEEEEEVEPKLKYERLSNNISTILKKDTASCIAVHPKVSSFSYQYV